MDKNKLTAELEWQRDTLLPVFDVGKLFRYWLEYRYLQEIIDYAPSHTVDLGCGIATPLRFIPGVKTGVDPLAHEYQKIQRYPTDVRAIATGAEHADDVSTNSVDLVICTNVLDHVTDPYMVMAEVRRVLKKNGRLLLSCEIRDAGEQRDEAHPHNITFAWMLELLDGFLPLHSYFRKDVPGVAEYFRGESAPGDHKTLCGMFLQPNRGNQ